MTATGSRSQDVCQNPCRLVFEPKRPSELRQPNDRYRWQVVTSDYPSSDRWLTYGPPLTLRGEGTRIYNLRSGDWNAVPQDPDSQCSAEQTAVVSAGVVSSPQAEVGQTGQPLSFRVLPDLFSIEMTGYCLWEKLTSS
jgi:hypothetical protein